MAAEEMHGAGEADSATTVEPLHEGLSGRQGKQRVSVERGDGGEVLVDPRGFVEPPARRIRLSAGGDEAESIQQTSIAVTGGAQRCRADRLPRSVQVSRDQVLITADVCSVRTRSVICSADSRLASTFTTTWTGA